MNITAIGIDIAKNIFQIHGVDNKGKCVLQKKVTRVKLLSYVAQLPKCKKSLGERLVTKFLSTTTFLLIHLAPALIKSDLIE
jgi:hypothetical protein